MEHAYSLNRDIPAETVTADYLQLSSLVARDHGINMGVGLWSQWTTIEKNTVTAYPTSRIENPPTRWHVVDGETISYVTDGQGGTLYQITASYRQMTVPEAQVQASGDVASWMSSYGNSYFVYDGKWYSADTTKQVSTNRKTVAAQSRSNVMTWDGVTIALDAAGIAAYTQTLETHWRDTEDTANVSEDAIYAEGVTVATIISTVEDLPAVPTPQPTTGATTRHRRRR